MKKPHEHEVKARLWSVTGSTKEELTQPIKAYEARYYDKGFHLNIQAPTLVDAMNAALAHYPGASIWSISHRGEINLTTEGEQE